MKAPYVEIAHRYVIDQLVLAKNASVEAYLTLLLRCRTGALTIKNLPQRHHDVWQPSGSIRGASHAASLSPCERIRTLVAGRRACWKLNSQLIVLKLSDIVSPAVQ